MPKKNNESPAYELLAMVWRHTNDATQFSWRRLNQSMRSAIFLAIEAGFRFDLADFATIAQRFDSSRWIPCADAGLGEGAYSAAVLAGNLSAAKSFEAWRNRPPFIVDVIERTSRYAGGGPARGRLAVGYQFRWEGRTVTVTSFSTDGQAIVACSHHLPGPTGIARIARRFRISIDDLRAEMTRRRKAAKAAPEARQ